MDRLFQQLQNIIDENNSNHEINGMIAYLLTNEEEPYKLYRLNLASNDGLLEIIKNNILNVPSDITFFNYPDCTSPDGRENISYIRETEIPDYNVIKDRITNDRAQTIDKNTFRDIINNIKGYAIKVLYTVNNQEVNGNLEVEQGEFICFSKLTKTCLFEPKHRMFKFNGDEGDIMEEVEDIFLKFNEKIAAINFREVVFALHGWYFEQILKYEEHINNTSVTMLEGIKGQNLIRNFDLLEERCINNKNHKKKLYKISNSGNINNINIDKFRQLKNIHGESLVFSINDDSTISVDEENQSKSIDHILRIYNDEVAETFITETRVFANQKIKIG